MCGIIGYIGKRKVTDVLINGLKCLEYRGYDSAGISIKKKKEIKTIKSIGKIVNLEEKVKDLEETFTLGIGHTRWATHGKVNLKNCHPHSVGKVTLVHNGIIENYGELKKELSLKGYQFKTTTDTEIICALIDSYNGSKIDALEYAKSKLRGSYALLILFQDEDEEMFAIRKDSPLVIGIGENENFVASDISAILPYTKKCLDLEKDEIVKITKEKVEVYVNHKRKTKEIKMATWDFEDGKRDGFEKYMLKEMNEQKDLIGKLASKFIIDNQYAPEIPDLTRYQKIDIVACGSAYYAGWIGKYFIDKYVDMEVSIEVASEYRYKKHFYHKNTLVILVSQSGETADTLASLRMAKECNVDTLAIVNVISSSMAKEAKYVMPMHAGLEIAVATTKGYFTQVLELSLLAQKLGYMKKAITEQEKNAILSSLKELTEKITKVLTDDYTKIAAQLYTKEHIYFIGRGIDYPVLMEASLKLKEISYIHSDVYQAGELKHGPIALIEENTPVITLITDENLKEKTLSNALEAKSRGAKITLVLREDLIVDESLFDTIIKIPKTNEFYQPLISIIPFQKLAYEIAKKKGCDIDKPKNLAKSVTVE